ncbi:MAG: hypothetical protein J5472_00010 [Clostridia bacterium]|nr:hypothetical protein [Clostridia bacterium]
MKKAMVWLLSLMLVLSAAGVWAEEEETVFEEMSQMEWSFLSGVGGWSTDLHVEADGSFTGEFHDGELGETGEDYPNGTIYGCLFEGRFSYAGEAENNAVKIRVDALTLTEGQVPEAIEDGVRYVTVDEVYGLTEGDEMLLYAPGTPVSIFSEELLFWAHVMDREDPPAELDNWFLCSEKNETGFVGYAMENAAGLANPWLDLTAEELTSASCISFYVPEGAEQVIYRYLPDMGLAEMQFTLDGDEYCARILPVDRDDGEMQDISGIYLAWEQEEAVSIQGCPGTLGLAQTGSEDFVELCQWFDAPSGLVYSLSVYTTDPDGLDLTAVAEQVNRSVLGDV